MFKRTRCTGVGLGFCHLCCVCLKIRETELYVDVYACAHTYIYIYVHLYIFSLLGLPFGNGEIPGKLCNPFNLRIIIQWCMNLSFRSLSLMRCFQLVAWEDGKSSVCTKARVCVSSITCWGGSSCNLLPPRLVSEAAFPP